MAIARIMCFGSNSKEDPDAQKNKEIEKQLREDQKKMAREIKLLLLDMPLYIGSIVQRITDVPLQVLESLGSLQS